MATHGPKGIAWPGFRGTLSHPVPEGATTGLAHALLDLLLPRGCFRCGDEGDDPLCRVCLASVPAAPEPAARAGLARIVAGAPYAGEVEAWVQRFKYPSARLDFDPGPKALLGALLARATAELPAPDRVIPIPLHPRRLRARGFNPAGRLARSLARSRGLRFDPVALVRCRDTESQTGLSAAARRRNVAGAFVGTGRVPRGTIWLVDDVVTTGSTLEAAARALRREGGTRVIGVAAAAAT